MSQIKAPERVLFTMADFEFGQSGDPDSGFTMRGHAAVFNRASHDLGGFVTKIAPGAFSKILDTSPDVHLVWDHDMRYVLARTMNKTLELRADPVGLHVWARFAKTSYAADLAELMRRGDVDQMSFACNIGEDSWTEDKDGITRTILSVDGLFDVTVCAQGAFPQTDASLVASARQSGRLPGGAVDLADVAPERVGDGTGDPIAASSPGGEDVAQQRASDRQREAARAKARAAASAHA